MEYFWLYLGVLITWILNSMAAASELAVKAVKSGQKDYGGVSIMWGVFIMPILFTGFAGLVNIKWEPMGFWLVGSLHSFFGLWMLGYIVYAVIYIKRNE